jgi:hypothetical protein
MRLSRLEKKLEAVCDEDSFVEFIDALAADRFDEVKKEARKPSPPYCPGANGWENGSIETFLAAAARWADDWKRSSGQYKKAKNAWKRCAEIIYMGKHYE